MGRERIELLNAEETILFGQKIAKELSPNSILALQGDLGAGKTTFVQGLLQGLGIQDTAQSPTFIYLQIYLGALPVYHFDLYRLKRPEDFVDLGFDEFLESGGITVIEWPERMDTTLLPKTKWIELIHNGTTRVALL